MDEIESQMLLSHVETWMMELEREVRAFEAAVEEVEEIMNEVEYAEERDDADGQTRPTQDLQQLERVLETTERVAQLVHAADSALSEAIVTIYQSVEGDASLSDTPLEEGTLILGGKYRIVQLLHQRTRLNLYLAQRQTVGADLSSPSPIYRPSPDMPQFIALPLVPAQPVGATTERSGAPINPSRPAPQRSEAEPFSILRPPPDSSQFIAPTNQQEPLVAIRELVLTGLPPQVRKQIEHAAFEEFVSPGVLGSPRLPGAGDRVRVEGERHYLVMQLRRAKGERPAVAVTLAELLLSKRQWPSWLDLETALAWGVQLCRIVARLHRFGTVLGDLDPATILVDSEGAAQWAPVLLVSWPPPPQFWPAFPASLSAAERHTRIFPVAHLSANKAFAAPEMLNGVCDSRSDVYSLGALLYLLLTRYAPASAARRMRAVYRSTHVDRKNHQDGLGGRKVEQGQALPLPYKMKDEGNIENGHSRHDGFVPQTGTEGMALISPHLFNSSIPPALEQIVLRSLALDPAERYSTVFELVEALESEEVKSALAEASASANEASRASRVGKMVEWLKRELNE